MLGYRKWWSDVKSEDESFLGRSAVWRWIALMMEAVRTSETLVYLNETSRRSITESYHLHTRRCEKLRPLMWKEF
jgi:hypothetical protein